MRGGLSNPGRNQKAQQLSPVMHRGTLRPATSSGLAEGLHEGGRPRPKPFIYGFLKIFHFSENFVPQIPER
jgi:hypothetical protein